eukprot:2551693-Amphidinium_carterae.1
MGPVGIQVGPPHTARGWVKPVQRRARAERPAAMASSTQACERASGFVRTYRSVGMPTMQCGLLFKVSDDTCHRVGGVHKRATLKNS